jgi:hypothetical protein
MALNPRRRRAKFTNPASSHFRNRWRDLSLRSSRDDRTPIELFLGGVRAWEAGLRRQFDHDKPKLE